MTEITKSEQPVDEMTRLRNLYADMHKIVMNPMEPASRREEAQQQRLNIFIKMQKLASSTNQNNIFAEVPIQNTNDERAKVDAGLAQAEAKSKAITDIMQAINDNEIEMSKLPVHSLEWEKRATMSMSLRQKLNRETQGVQNV